MKRPEGSLISYFSNRVKKEGGINLAQGTPGFPPPGELLQLLKTNAEDKRLHQYAPGIGNFELLELIRQRFSSQVIPTGLDNLLIVQGATEGIFLAFFYLTTFLERPFAALSFDPVYESYPQLADMFCIPFEYFDFEENLAVDFDKLEKVIKEKNVKVVFIASPGNPLGKTWSKNEMSQTIALSQKYGFYILFDAVYKDIYFSQAPFNPLAFNYDKLFYIDSFSKMLSITGWRIGYIITEAGHMKKIRAIHDYVGLCAPSILQAAVARYLSAFDYGKNYTGIVRNKCKQSFYYMKKELESIGFKAADSHGGYFLWARLPEINKKWKDAFEFALSLYQETRVGVVPGENFSNSKTDYVRMNIGSELPIIKDAASRLKKFFNRPIPCSTTLTSQNQKGKRK
ncbi:MAG: pyridoxal phosphate-dependent aminotransferase [Candidatus Aminicenantes bacterium]|nr:MAG: pyridoxal phosphate-dependent aminotransferase [Candidatus Aminicenantes bacterium]